VYDNYPELFRWESEDGSSVLVFNAGDLWYNGHVDPENVTNVFDFEEESGLRDYLNLYGVGDHGGGPTPRGRPYHHRDERVAGLPGDDL